jgi:NADH-quinone oxidoreductase subunit L
MDFVIHNSWLIPLLPLIGALIAGFFGAKWLKGRSHWPIWIGVGISAALVIVLLVGMIARAAHQPTEAPQAQQVTAQQLAAGGFEAVHHQYPLSYSTTWWNWITAGHFNAEAGSWIDPLTAIMLTVVTFVGLLILIFSAGYMAGEEGYFRFFAYMGLFIFSMTCLVLANNFVMLYLGWEGVGVCSYLLIGYYYDKPSAREAAKKAFLVNRVGDFSFGIANLLIFMAFGTVSYFGTPGNPGALIQAAGGNLTHFQSLALGWIPFLLMIGAFGKSAQFPLYVWLPDAMEGPTPVSAMLHAATMVTAGVYMIVRCSTMFVGNNAAMLVIAIIGCFTAFLSASIAMRQFDLKKVFAYSTISQLGFMFTAVGCLAPVAGIFHLVTHAFFKALLFLCCGVVMHAMAGELDMRKLSGLKRRLPWTRWLILIGCLALAAFPGFSGFWSKDEIVGASLDQSVILGIAILGIAFMTAYYTFRLYFRVFEGPEMIPEAAATGHGHGHEPHEHAAASESAIQTGTAPASGVDVGQAHHTPSAHSAPHAAHEHHNPEPFVMIFPLVILAIGAIFVGYINFPSEWLSDFLGKSPSLGLGFLHAQAAGAAVEATRFGQEGAHVFHLSLMIISGLVAIAGILVAWWLHLADRKMADRMLEWFRGAANVLDHKYWVDEIYQQGIVEPLRNLGRAFYLFDRAVIDGIVWLISFIPQASGLILKRSTQRGYLQGYAVTMLFGIAVILILIFL